MSVEAQVWVETIVRDAWRRYKHKSKNVHFLKYSNMTKKLKHCPLKVPIAYFRRFCQYWSKETIQQCINEDDEKYDVDDQNFKRTT